VQALPRKRELTLQVLESTLHIDWIRAFVEMTGVPQWPPFEATVPPGQEQMSAEQI
jgi:hypothetical protein